MSSVATAAPPSDETLDLLVDLTRTIPDAQIATGSAHDDKAFKLAASGSVLLGFLALSTNPERDLVYVAGGAYVAVVIGVLWCVYPRRYEIIRHGETLWPEYWDATPRQVKHAIAARVPEATAINKAILKSKLIGLLVALVALAVETVVIVAIVLAS